MEKKGDIKRPRINTIMPRLAYVYEGIDTEENGRPKLVNVKYFGVYDGTGEIERFWKEVYEYIERFLKQGKKHVKKYLTELYMPQKAKQKEKL